MARRRVLIAAMACALLVCGASAAHVKKVHTKDYCRSDKDRPTYRECVQHAAAKPSTF